MPLKIVRNDITQMNTEAIVSMTNDYASVGAGGVNAVYQAAGYNELLKYTEDHIGIVPEGGVFITPGFKLRAKYIIHAIRPLYKGGDQGEEEKLRSCYRKSLQIAKEKGIKSISFPLIFPGNFGYPKEEGLRIAVDEMNAFLSSNEMDIFLVAFDSKSTQLRDHLFPELEVFIHHNYVKKTCEEEYDDVCSGSEHPDAPEYAGYHFDAQMVERSLRWNSDAEECSIKSAPLSPSTSMEKTLCSSCMDIEEADSAECADREVFDLWDEEDVVLELEEKLKERLAHRADTFSEYLLYLIESKNMTNVEVYKRACLTKQYFHKINKNKDFHPEKIKALLLCVGARLSLDETKDLLARAGYALSPADLTDIIFAFFIEHKHYDVIDIDIQLEEHGLPCVIS